MKLYTEEQVRNMLDTFLLFTGNEDANDYIEYMTPIELPNDEEIKEISSHEILYNDSKRTWWLDGAKYILNVIKLQYEKETKAIN